MRYRSVALVLALALPLALSLTLSGCTAIADLPLVGVPANAPARPESTGTYLPVHDLPPPREEEMMPVSEQTRIEKELSAARAKAKATAASDAAAIAGSSPPVKAKSPPKKKAEKPERAEKATE